jgi:hypothetical protein
MQVRDPNTHLWIPYQTIPAWQAYGSSTCAYKPGMQSILSLFKNPPQTGTNGVNQLITLAYFLSDPRTLRFGTPTITNLSSQPNVDLEQGGTPQAFGQTATFGAGLFNPATLNAYPSSWAYNALGPRCSSTYQDADGVTRVGDGNPALAPAAASAWESAAVVGAPPSKAAPYFLGRSFNSVADMGYASRDMAWKSVNFFTADSADSALLDFFSLTESPAYAGGVNVNTASVPVLTALLQGAAADTSDNTGSGRLTAAQAKAIATAIRSYLGTTRTKLLSTNNRGGPGTGSPYNPGNANNNTIAFDPSDIARINEAVTDAGVINISTPPFGVSAVPYGEKRAQEVVARALADSWNTRTWNLMIDIIAQTGRFPRSVTTGGTDFGANFVVTGERREWAHVAIDRFTGKVLAVKVEPVNE